MRSTSGGLAWLHKHWTVSCDVMHTYSSETLVGLGLVVGFAGLHEAVEPAGVWVLTRGFALRHLLRVTEDGQVLCDGVCIPT